MKSKQVMLMAEAKDAFQNLIYEYGAHVTHFDMQLEYLHLRNF